MNRRLILWFALGAAVIVADAIACYWSIGRLIQNQGRQEQSAETVRELDQFLSHVKDAETGQRGYVLTGDPKYLAPYEGAAKAIDADLDHLTGRFTDSRKQAQVAQMRGLVNQKLAELAQTVRLRQQEGFDAARAVVLQDRGRQYMVALRQLVTGMEQAEDQELARQSAQSRASGRNALATLGLVVAINAALLIAVLMVIRADASRQSTAYESQARLAAIVESSDDAIVSKTLEGIIVTWNRGAERVFGYAAEEAIGKPILMLLPDDRKEEEAGFLAKLRRGERIDHYHTLRVRKDGRVIRVSLTISPLRNAAGQIIGASKIARDVTGEYEAQEQVRRLNETLEHRVEERTAELAEVNQQLETFGYSVSHDLRAPLRAMQGFAQALLEDYGDRLDETGRNFAQRIVAAAKRMDTMILDLLAYSRLQRGKIELETVDLRQLVQRTIAELDGQLTASRAQVRCELPDCRVLANRAVLAQMLVNLLENSVKFVASGAAPHVRIRCEDRGPFVRITVEDDGIGIAPEDQEKIFNVFERLHGAERYPGTGVGLAIVRKGAERMGGRAGVDSDVGRGSRFWIDLRRADAPDAAAAEAQR